MTIILVGFTMLQIVSIFFLVKEITYLAAKNQELRDSNEELLEINYKLTNKKNGK